MPSFHRNRYDDWEKPLDVMINKTQTKEGSLHCPNTLHSHWNSNFSDSPNFTYCDIYTYLINKEGYDHEFLKGPQGIQVILGHFSINLTATDYFVHFQIRLDFLPVGHTHENIDASFRCICKAFGTNGYLHHRR